MITFSHVIRHVFVRWMEVKKVLNSGKHYTFCMTAELIIYLILYILIFIICKS